MKDISRREFMQKAMLYAIIVLLFLAILLILVIRIIR
jgi:cell division protein FtsX